MSRRAVRTNAKAPTTEVMRASSRMGDRAPAATLAPEFCLQQTHALTQGVAGGAQAGDVLIVLTLGEVPGEVPEGARAQDDDPHGALVAAHTSPRLRAPTVWAGVTASTAAAAWRSGRPCLMALRRR